MYNYDYFKKNMLSVISYKVLGSLLVNLSSTVLPSFVTKIVFLYYFIQIAVTFITSFCSLCIAKR